MRGKTGSIYIEGGKPCWERVQEVLTKTNVKLGCDCFFDECRQGLLVARR